jgi:glucose/arabinose dehydrogenase
MRKLQRWLGGATLVWGLAAHAADTGAVRVESEKLTFELHTVTTGLEHPWGVVVLPDGRALVSERPGRLRLVERDGRISAPLAGVPAVAAKGQGGLLDVALHPDFSANQLIYFSYSEPASNGDGNSTAVARGRLDGLALRDVLVIFRQQPKFDSPAHFGSRLVFARDGALFVTLGDRYHRRDDAQTLDNHHGKVVRIRDDGATPADNPFVANKGALPQIWSYGHRNLQGAALHPVTGELWTHEHGPRGGDELNVARAGRNYGWPVITYGKEYIGGSIGEGTHKTGMEQPLKYWVPSIAPSGMTFVDARIPVWQGNVLIGSLAFDQLVRLELDGEKVVHEERLLKKELGERIRDVEQGPDGAIYLLTDENDGKLLRLMPRS